MPRCVFLGGRNGSWMAKLKTVELLMTCEQDRWHQDTDAAAGMSISLNVPKAQT